MTAKTDESKYTQIEANEALSNSTKGMLEVSEMDRHIASSMTTRNTEGETEEKTALSNKDTDTTQHTNPLPPKTQAETTNIEPPPVRGTGSGQQRLNRNAEFMGKGRSTQRATEPPRMTAPPFTQKDMDTRIRERIARQRQQQENPLSDIIPPEHQQTLNRQFGNGIQQTTCMSKRQPVYEKLQIAIERISEELGDFKHVTSNITQAENIRREAHADIEQFIVMLYEARAATKHAVTTGKITKQNSTGQLVKMPYFYAVLREKAGLPKVQRTI